jgi:hypothetical protein
MTHVYIANLKFHDFPSIVDRSVFLKKLLKITFVKKNLNTKDFNRDDNSPLPAIMPAL